MPRPSKIDNFNTSLAVNKKTIEALGTLRQPIIRYEGKNNHFESNEQVIKRLIDIYMVLVEGKFNNLSPNIVIFKAYQRVFKPHLTPKETIPLGKIG